MAGQPQLTISTNLSEFENKYDLTGQWLDSSTSAYTPSYAGSWSSIDPITGEPALQSPRESIFDDFVAQSLDKRLESYDSADSRLLDPPKDQFNLQKDQVYDASFPAFEQLKYENYGQKFEILGLEEKQETAEEFGRYHDADSLSGLLMEFGLDRTIRVDPRPLHPSQPTTANFTTQLSDSPPASAFTGAVPPSPLSLTNFPDISPLYPAPISQFSVSQQPLQPINYNINSTRAQHTIIEAYDPFYQRTRAPPTRQRSKSETDMSIYSFAPNQYMHPTQPMDMMSLSHNQLSQSQNQLPQSHLSQSHQPSLSGGQLQNAQHPMSGGQIQDIPQVQQNWGMAPVLSSYDQNPVHYNTSPQREMALRAPRVVHSMGRKQYGSPGYDQGIRAYSQQTLQPQPESHRVLMSEQASQSQQGYAPMPNYYNPHLYQPSPTSQPVAPSSSQQQPPQAPPSPTIGAKAFMYPEAHQSEDTKPVITSRKPESRDNDVQVGSSTTATRPVRYEGSRTTVATIEAAMRRRNPNSEARFVCDMCGETFTRRYNLRGHQRAHRNEKPFKCSYDGCEKAFARAHDCKRHELLHLGVRRYHCEPCRRNFVRLDALQRHHRSDVGQACVQQLRESGIEINYDTTPSNSKLL